MDISDYKLIAHRGLHSEKLGIPENSIEAFKRAIEKGYAIETDVHVTHDRKLVIYHDHDLERLTGKKAKIEDITLAEIQELKLSNTEYSIPTLEEFLSLVDGKVPLLIEIKNNNIANGPEKELLEAMQNYKGKYAVESFNPISIKYFKDNAPNIPRGLLTQKHFEDIKSTIKKFFLENIKPPRIWLQLDFMAYDIDDLTQEIADKYRRENMYVLGWTIKTHEQFEKAKKLCDGIIFENIEPKEIS